MVPDDVPPEMAGHLVNVDSALTIRLEHEILSYSDVLHPDHADNMYQWAAKQDSLKLAQGCSFEHYRRAPTYPEVYDKHVEHEEDLKRIAKEQAQRDSLGQNRNFTEAAAAPRRSGGGVMAAMANSMQSLTSGGSSKGKGSKGKGKSKSSIAMPASSAGLSARGTKSVVGSSFGGSVNGELPVHSQPDARPSEEAFSPAPVASRARVGRMSRQVGRADGAGTTPDKTIAEQLRDPTAKHLIGTQRKGSSGRTLKDVDLMAVFAGEDPGREIAAAWERQRSYVENKKPVEQALEDEFIELALAGKAWMLPAVLEGRTSDLQKSWLALAKEKVTMPFAQRTEFNRKVAGELAIECSWSKWAAVVLFDSELPAAKWDARAPQFSGNLEDMPEPEFQHFKKYWQESVLCNGVIQALLTTTATDWSPTRAITDAFFASDENGVTTVFELLDQCERARDMMNPVVKFLLGMRLCCDPAPYPFGATSQDYYFVFPGKEGANLDSSDYFEEALPLGKAIMRQITKHGPLLDKATEYVQFLGAEGAVGSNWC